MAPASTATFLRPCFLKLSTSPACSHGAPQQTWPSGSEQQMSLRS
jgi:hypothetical protein